MSEPKQDESHVDLSVASTSCRQCIFCEYKDNEQVGCHADRLQLFTSHDIPIIEMEDDEKKYFVIKDKACSYFRHIDAYSSVLAETSMPEVRDRVQDSLRIPYQVMLFFRSGDTLETLKERLDELHEQDVRPCVVTIIDRTHSSDDFSPQIVGLFHRDYSFKDWRTQRIRSTDTTDLAAVDICYDNTKKIKFFFYTTFEASKPIPSVFSREIHDSIINKMQSFTFLKGVDGHHGRTVLRLAHAKYGGNSFDVDISVKLSHYNDSVELIKSVEELCPSLKK